MGTSIPKIIHYCWFGKTDLPESAKRCIDSWKKYCPDYQIKVWDESNFDINSNAYISEAYNARKWAFVSDYARFEILYKNGGLYFDTDVELIKPIDDIVSNGAFMGIEAESGKIAPGLGIGSAPENSLYKEIIDYYRTQHFISDSGGYNLETVVDRVTNIFLKYGFNKENTLEIQNVAGISIYPKEYFCPVDFSTMKINITENTRSIHHYDASWHDDETKRLIKAEQACKRVFGKGILSWILFRIYKYSIKLIGTFRK